MIDRPDLHCATCADAARLRQIFNDAARTYPQNCGAMPMDVQAWWAALYAAIRDSRAGLDLLAQLGRAESEVEALRAQLRGAAKDGA